MKKILAVILCLLMLFAPSVYAENSSADIEVLKALDIGNFDDAEEIILRGSFVGAVSDILNYFERPKTCDGIFSDVVKEYEYSGAIYDAYGRGLISGYSDGTFGVNSPILYEHAIKILVSALGFDALAAVQGGYPSGYMTIAAQNKIIKGVKKTAGDTLTGGEAARLIVNAMNTPVLQQVVFGEKNPGYETYPDETMLSSYARIKKIEGIVSDNGITSLSGNSAVQIGNVIINGNVYSAEKSMAEDLLGCKVVAYVTAFSDGNDKVLYIKPAESVRMLEIGAGKLICDDNEFSVRNIVYEDVYGNITSAKVDGAADVIYNGKAYLDLTASDLNLSFGKIILVDNDSDSIYDCLHIEANEIFLVAGVSSENKIIYKKSGSSLKLSGVRNISASRDGEECSIQDLKEYDVVSAGISVDKSMVTLRASSKTLSGKVESIESATKTISVNGTYYHVSNSDVLDKISITCSYEFCMDTEGNIAAIKSELGTDKYVGILIDAINEGTVGSKIKVRIYSSLGSFDDISLAERVTIDGNSSMTDNQKLLYIQNNMLNKLVCCIKDSKGNLTEINLPYSGTPGTHQNKDSFRVDFADGDKVSTCYVGGGVRNFAGQVLAKTDATKVFIVPADITEYDSYAVAKASYFKHCTNYNILAYSIGAENGCSEYIINLGKDVEEYTSDHRPMVVTKVSSVLDDNGEIVSAVSGIASGAEVKYVEKTPGMILSAGIKKGDVMRYQLDTEIRLADVVRIVDGTNVKTLQEENPTNYGASPRFALYDVYDRFGNIVGITKTDLSKGFKEEIVEAGLLRQTVNTSYIYLVDTKRDNEVRKATYNDINAYKTVYSERSRIFVYSYSGSESLVVIYN